MEAKDCDGGSSPQCWIWKSASKIINRSLDLTTEGSLGPLQRAVLVNDGGRS